MPSGLLEDTKYQLYDGYQIQKHKNDKYTSASLFSLKEIFRVE